MSSQYGELRLTNYWDQLASLGHLSKFQRVSRLGFVTARTSLIGGQPNCAWCLPSPGLVHFIYILGSSCPLTKFCHVQMHFASKSCILLYWQHYCKAFEQWAWAKVGGMVHGMELWNFCSSSFSTDGATCIPRVAITLGIDPHSMSIHYRFSTVQRPI